MIRGHVFQNQIFSNDAFALFMDFVLNKKSGVIKGCQVSNTSSTVSVGEGYFWVKGRPIQIIGTETKNVDTDTAYCKLICEIDLSKENTDTELNQVSVKIIKSSTAYPTLTQEDLTDGGVIYQFPFAQFKITNGKVSDFTSLVEYIDYESIYKTIQDKLDAIVNESEIIKKCKLAPYPVGIVIFFDSDADPNKELGGTWQKIAIGETLVGQDDGDFKTIGSSVGSKFITSEKATGNTGSTTLTIDQIPSHSHPYADDTGSMAYNFDRTFNGSGVASNTSSSKSTGSIGGGKGHVHTLNEHTHRVNTYQPSHVGVYWKRVA